jgi:hypothetical protein
MMLKLVSGEDERSILQNNHGKNGEVISQKNKPEF